MEIAYILYHLDMTVEKVDQWSHAEDDEWMAIPRLFLPADLEQRTELLVARLQARYARRRRDAAQKAATTIVKTTASPTSSRT